MSNKILERLISINFAITLIFAMIVKGKIGVVGFTIFLFITCILAWRYQKRTESEKRMTLIERIFVVGLGFITITFGYLSVFKPESNLTDIFMFLFMIWAFGGLIILSIRARRKRRGY